MPEKKLAAFVGATGPSSEPAARRTCQPVSASAPVSARATCAEPPRGKKNSAEQTRPATGPVGRAGRGPFSPSPRSGILLRFGRGAGDSCRRRAAAATTRTTLPPAGPTNRQEANAKYRSAHGSMQSPERAIAHRQPAATPSRDGSRRRRRSLVDAGSGRLVLRMTKLEDVVLLRGRRARVLDCDGRGSVGAVAARAARLPHPGRGTRPLAHTCDRGRETIDLFR